MASQSVYKPHPTATGLKAQPQLIAFPSMARSSMGGVTAPQHPPFKYTDDTLIYISVPISSPRESPSTSATVEESKPLLKWLSEKLQSSSSKVKEDFKVIRLPRSEYLKNFARDNNNNYIGTEAEKVWSEEDLDAVYGKYWEWERTKWVLRHEAGTGKNVMVEKGREELRIY